MQDALRLPFLSRNDSKFKRCPPLLHLDGVKTADVLTLRENISRKMERQNVKTLVFHNSICIFFL